MPKVLFVTTSDSIGGMGRVALDLARNFAARGWRVRAVFPDTVKSPALIEWARRQGARAEANPAVRDIVDAHRLRDMGALRRLAAASNPDIVNIHYGENYISLKDVIAVRLSGRRRCIVTVHHPVPWSSMNGRKRVMTRVAAMLAHDVTATSVVMRDILLEAGVPAGKIHVLPPGVQAPARRPNRAEARARLGLPSDAFVVSSLSRLVPHKGIGDLIEATARVPDPRGALMLVVAGEGEERAALETLAASRLGDRAVFLGHLPDTADLYAASDIFALPSYMEGFGLVYVEAAFHGVPSVGCAVGGAQPVRVDGSPGSLYNAPPTGPFTGYPVVGAYNEGEAPDRRTITVNFPAAGTYPFEMDYTESHGNQLALTLETSVPPPPTATPTNTHVPPTATPTNTPVPPANTPAPVPPANTPVPPSATATQTPPANTFAPAPVGPPPASATAGPSGAAARSRATALSRTQATATAIARASATAAAQASATAIARASATAIARASATAIVRARATAAARTLVRPAGTRWRASVSPPLNIVVSPKNVYSDGMVTVRARTAPGARLRIKLQVTTSRRTFIKKGKRRIGTTRTVVLYGIQRDARANGRGQVSVLLKIAYQPAAPVRGNLAVTSTTAHGAATRVARLRIQALPLAVGVTPKDVRFDRVVVVNARTLPYAAITADLRALSTRTTSTGVGKRRKTVVHTTVVFRTALRGRADKHGRFVGRLRVTRELGRPLPGSLTVTASTRQGAATSDTRLTVRP